MRVMAVQIGQECIVALNGHCAFMGQQIAANIVMDYQYLPWEASTGKSLGHGNRRCTLRSEYVSPYARRCPLKKHLPAASKPTFDAVEQAHLREFRLTAKKSERDDSHQCINTHLLKTSTTELVEFTPDRIPAYAILSHTWEHDEVRFTDMLHQTAETRQAWPKVLSASKQALACGYEYIWDDTCSIDKSSSAELTEAIYSMFMWYENAAIRYAYLSDYTIDRDVNGLDVSKLEQCRWFTRGWT
ncbi:hypothetical protein ETB97_005548 [Aspergillus alliaceus]|uniref:Heterokaryon incompatibility domain-containing protein n=1 Tax=Petromyces alliaceus TaxID=209559 RepID=A0A8H5ZYW5_PETAA|nr:hypothetical protein ETB97_005548 [Aspergillus burnettii]